MELSVPQCPLDGDHLSTRTWPQRSACASSRAGRHDTSGAPTSSKTRTPTVTPLPSALAAPTRYQSGRCSSTSTRPSSQPCAARWGQVALNQVTLQQLRKLASTSMRQRTRRHQLPESLERSSLSSHIARLERVSLSLQWRLSLVEGESQEESLPCLPEVQRGLLGKVALVITSRVPGESTKRIVLKW